MMQDRSVQPGDDLDISARVWNDLLDIRQRDRMNRLNSGGEDAHKGRNATIVKVKNNSGADRARFTVLGLSGPHVHPADLELSFKDRPALVGVVPTAEHRFKFCILLEPIPSTRTGRAVMAGVTIARVERTETEYACAEPIKDQHDRLKNVPHGSASILWLDDFPEGAEGDTATVWAIIRIDACDREAHVKITSDSPDENGFYDAIVQEFDLDELAWVDKYEIKVLDVDDDIS